MLKQRCSSPVYLLSTRGFEVDEKKEEEEEAEEEEEEEEAEEEEETQ